MIDFTRAFSSAWERMTIILFQPFDFGKWCVVGFSAFLAGLLAGGNGVNLFRGNSSTKNFNFNETSSTSSAEAQAQLREAQTQFAHFFSSMAFGMMIALFAGIFLVILALKLLFSWLGARGQFLFLDNIVRNRGAIAWPWQNYARPANRFFILYLILEVIACLLFLTILGVALLVCIPLIQHHRWPQGAEIGELIALGVGYLLVAVAVYLVLFLFREFGIPIMFRQGITAPAAFTASMNLVRLFPGSVCVFILLRLAIFIAMAIVCIILCCATMLICCLSQWPYIGTVILLPALVYVRCFTLDCLAQFGPQYDVFTIDVPPAGDPPGISPSVTPPPQPG